jgi:hypothetical protein
MSDKAEIVSALERRGGETSGNLTQEKVGFVGLLKGGSTLCEQYLFTFIVLLTYFSEYTSGAAPLLGPHCATHRLTAFSLPFLSMSLFADSYCQFI